MEKVVVEAPATSANLGPGFDVFALALREPRDRLELELAPARGTFVEIAPAVSAALPTEPQKNAAGAVALSIAKKFGLEGRMTIRITKGVPIGVGLGSSGASSAAAAVALDRAFGLRMGDTELVSQAGEGERATSGAAHLDNVTASILGGFVVVRQGGAPLRFDPPESLSAVVVTPEVSLPERKTEYARALVPKSVPLGGMVSNVSMASVMVAGFARRDAQLIGEGMEDAVVEVARAKMVPGFFAVKEAAKAAGAAGVCISGAGPTVLSLVDGSRQDPGSVLDAMVEGFESEGARAKGFVTSVGEGARVVEGP